MKKFALLAFLLLTIIFSNSQTPSDAANYLSSINSAHADMNQKYMAYMSIAAHGRRARKIEKMRIQALTSISTSRNKTVELPYYQGDKTLRASSLDYIQLCYNVFNEDYAKIVNLEEIAEQSIDQMEAYILLQEKTSEKIKIASDKMQKASKEFAFKYKVNLIESKSELSEKIELADTLNQYVNKLYIIFFKCNFQDGQLTQNLNDNKLSSVEQSRNSLVNYADQGLKEIELYKSFYGDSQLADVCKQALNEYKKMALTDIPKITNYHAKKERFEKLQKEIESNNQRTKEDIDKFNNAVKDINRETEISNQVNNSMNEKRNAIVQNWESAQKSFLDIHMPYFKK